MPPPGAAGRGAGPKKQGSAGGSQGGRKAKLNRDEGKELSWKEWVRHALTTVTFDVCIGAVISLNAVSIGVEQGLELGGHDLTAVKVLESAFLTVYIVELGLRVFAHGAEVLRDPWVLFDFVMVALGIVTSWIIEPLAGNSEANSVMVLRTARMFRVIKTWRMLAHTEEFWMLIRSIVSSFPLMCYTCVVLFMVLYIFALLGVEVVTKNSLNRGPHPDPAFQEITSLYFDSLPKTMLTLINFACLDNMSDIWMPLISSDPWLALYFVMIVLVMGIILMNIITSVIISSTQEQNIAERDAHVQEEEVKLNSRIEELKMLFKRADIDGSGFLTCTEILGMSAADKEYLTNALSVGTPLQVFQALDVEGSGKVTINDFFEGVWDAGRAKDLKLQRMEKQVEMMHGRMRESLDAQYLLSSTVDRLVDQVETLVNKVESLRPASRRPTLILSEPFVDQAAGHSRSRRPSQQAAATGKLEAAWADALSTRLTDIISESLQRSQEEVRATAAKLGGDAGSSSVGPTPAVPPNPARTSSAERKAPPRAGSRPASRAVLKQPAAPEKSSGATAEKAQRPAPASGTSRSGSAASSTSPPSTAERPAAGAPEGATRSLLGPGSFGSGDSALASPPLAGEGSAARPANRAGEAGVPKQEARRPVGHPSGARVVTM